MNAPFDKKASRRAALKNIYAAVMTGLILAAAVWAIMAATASFVYMTPTFPGFWGRALVAAIWIAVFITVLKPDEWTKLETAE